MEARAHSVYTGNQVIILKTNIRFVSIDDEGNPIPIGEKGRVRITNLINELNESDGDL